MWRHRVFFLPPACAQGMSKTSPRWVRPRLRTTRAVRPRVDSFVVGNVGESGSNVSELGNMASPLPSANVHSTGLAHVEHGCGLPGARMRVMRHT